jgi:hypothetical protein
LSGSRQLKSWLTELPTRKHRIEQPDLIRQTQPAMILRMRLRFHAWQINPVPHVRPDDNETRISGARRADVTGVGAWQPSC